MLTFVFPPLVILQVIVGGIKVDNDWYPHPRKETTEDILKRALELCPELSPKYSTSNSRNQPTVEDLKPILIEEGCGLRPGRKGGIRLEKTVLKTAAGTCVPLVYNYGHGGYGFQSSWGSATIAAELLAQALFA